jgi:predicted PurR-regulated permease PerM
MAQYSRYTIPIIIVGAVIISVLLIKPFIVALITSAIIAYTFHPVFTWINKYIKNKTVAALTVSVLIISLLSIPVIILVNTISRDAYVLYVQGKEILVGGLPLDNCSSSFCETMRNWLGTAQVQDSIKKALETGTANLIRSASDFIVALPKKGIELFIVFFATFYFIRDGEIVTEKVKELLATKQTKKKEILDRFNNVMYAVIFGSLLVAFIQGVLGAIGFAIFGVSSPITWGIAMFFLALIPYFGTGLVWGPASLIFVVNGIIQNQNSMIWKGIGLFIYGVIFIASIDNVIKPKLIGQHSRVHPLLILVGIFGGISLLGIPGLVVGPVVIAMTLTLLDLYVH